ncbi:MAG: hypothetical protein ACWGPN_05185 [Gammaproteobacteria bacterium]
MTNTLSLIDLWSNPVFQRYRRAQLRLRKSIFWYLLTIIITTFVISLMYILETNSTPFRPGMPPESAARILWIPLLLIQGFILMIKGTGKTSAGLIQDKMDQTLDYQRLTPVSPLRNVIGYLFGLPILEYVMFALTLPHLIFIVIVGNIPLSTVLSVYFVFFTCTILYHITAIAMGMTMRRWIWGYLLSIVAVVFLNLILPTFVSQFGLKFLQYLSTWPVVGQKILPLIPQPEFGNPGFPFSLVTEPLPFFQWRISPFVFTIVLQTGLIVTFATMAVRRWQLASKHSLSKPYALGILIAFIILVIGNLWPAITGQDLPFQLFGTTSINDVSEVVAIGLPLVYSLTIWALCLFLFAVVVPTHNDYLRGIRRAAKLDRSAAQPWEDDSANMFFMALFIVIALAGYGVIYWQMDTAGFFDFLNTNGFAAWRPWLALGLVLTYSLLLLQALELRLTMLAGLLLWTLPILIAIVALAAMQELTTFHTIMASISPIGLVVIAALLRLEGSVPVQTNGEFDMITTGVNVGLVFIAVQIIALIWRWTALRKSFR